MPVLCGSIVRCFEPYRVESVRRIITRDIKRWVNTLVRSSKYIHDIRNGGRWVEIRIDHGRS
jgi:hypothetical protein